jgi:hypothetical protein
VHYIAPHACGWLLKDWLGWCDQAELIRIPEQREFDGRVFPLVWAPSAGSPLATSFPAFVEWLQAHDSEINEQVRVHGAVLFRGFPIATPEEFAAMLEDGLRIENLPYVGGAAVRTSIVRDRVFTSNESPPSEPIPYHRRCRIACVLARGEATCQAQ